MSTTPAPAPVRARRRVRPITVLLGLIVLAIGAMWVYILAFSSGDSPDRVHDHAWTAKAQQICAARRQAIDVLPNARTFLNVQPKSEALRRRADVADQVTVMLRSMVGDLRAAPGPDSASAATITAWLHDYDVYLGDRDKHVADLRAGIDQPFAETRNAGGEPGSLKMDQFARVNQMSRCQVPQDLG